MAANSRELAAIKRAARREQQARADLEQALAAGSAAGLSLRPMAAAAGLSVEWTRRLLAKAQGADL